MRAAGFDGFERGERGSTKEHLEVLDYKIQQDTKRLEELGAAIGEKQGEAADLDKQAKEKRKQLADMDKEIGKAKATVEEIEKMGSKQTFGERYTVTTAELTKLKTLAKKSVTADGKVKKANSRRDTAEKQLDAVVKERDELKKQVDAAKPSVLGHLSLFEKFKKAMERAPQKLMAAIEEILRQPPEKVEPQHGHHKKPEVSR